jgi:hypothetical protein
MQRSAEVCRKAQKGSSQLSRVLRSLVDCSVADLGSGAFCLLKKFYNSMKIGPHIFLQHFKNNIIFNFVKFMATKKGMTNNFFHPSLLLLFLDPG